MATKSGNSAKPHGSEWATLEELIAERGREAVVDLFLEEWGSDHHTDDEVIAELGLNRPSEFHVYPTVDPEDEVFRDLDGYVDAVLAYRQQADPVFKYYVRQRRRTLVHHARVAAMFLRAEGIPPDIWQRLDDPESASLLGERYAPETKAQIALFRRRGWRGRRRKGMRPSPRWIAAYLLRAIAIALSLDRYSQLAQMEGYDDAIHKYGNALRWNLPFVLAERRSRPKRTTRNAGQVAAWVKAVRRETARRKREGEPWRGAMTDLAEHFGVTRSHFSKTVNRAMKGKA